MGYMVGVQADDCRARLAGAEDLGQDVAELGIEAYPEFVLFPESDE